MIKENQSAQQKYIDSMKKKKRPVQTSMGKASNVKGKAMLLKDLKPEQFVNHFKKEVNLRMLFNGLITFLLPGLDTFKLCLLNKKGFGIMKPFINEQ